MTPGDAVELLTAVKIPGLVVELLLASDELFWQGCFSFFAELGRILDLLSVSAVEDATIKLLSVGKMLIVLFEFFPCAVVCKFVSLEFLTGKRFCGGTLELFACMELDGAEKLSKDNRPGALIELLLNGTVLDSLAWVFSVVARKAALELLAVG